MRCALRSLVPTALALLAGACGDGGPPQPAAGVLVIGIDGLRADHVSSYGYDRATTPTLDALATEGVRFLQAFTSAPVVLPAHISLFTGVHPGVARRFLPAEFEGLEERRWRIPRRVPHLAIELLAARRATAAFLDDPLLDPVYGFGPGFQDYRILGDVRPPQERARRQSDRFLSWLAELDEDRPWFAYLHFAALEQSWEHPDPEWERFFDPRPELDEEVPPIGNTDATFFAVPRSRWRGGARSLGDYEAAYDGHLRRLDEELERLVGYLRRTGRLAGTTLHVVGTHGVQFGEAGLYLRGGRYSMADLRVPWIVRPRTSGVDADAYRRGVESEALVSLVDVAPTVLALEGLAVPRGMHGHPRTHELRTDAPSAEAPAHVFASAGIQEGCAVIGERYCLEYLAPGSLDDVEMRRSWFGEREEDLGRPSVRFYDRQATPFPPLDEQVRGGPPEVLAAYREVLNTWLGNMYDTRRVLQPGPRSLQRVEPETIERLFELGYVGKQP